MKTLSIKQPYATLIAEGIKDIENRSFKTNFRGTFLIHASMQWHDRLKNGDLLNLEQRAELFLHHLKNKTDTNIYKYLEKNTNTPQHDLVTGAIIGQVDLVDFVVGHDSIWAEYSDPIRKDKLKEGIQPTYNWVLENAILYPEPILNIKGKLSFWEYDLAI